MFNFFNCKEHADLKRRLRCHRCPICSVLPWSVKDHLKTVHGYDPQHQDLGKSDQKCLECDHCDKKFHLAYKPRLKFHLLRKHFPILGTIALRAGKSIGSSTFSSLRIVEENGKFKCKTCNRLFTSYIYAVSHSRCNLL